MAEADAKQWLITCRQLKLISHFQMVMYRALHPMNFIFLNSSDLLEHLAMVQTLTLAINF